MSYMTRSEHFEVWMEVPQVEFEPAGVQPCLWQAWQAGVQWAKYCTQQHRSIPILRWRTGTAGPSSPGAELAPVNNGIWLRNVSTLLSSISWALNKRTVVALNWTIACAFHLA